MGYDTTFDGHVKISPPLSEAQGVYLNTFAKTRRMVRNAELAAAMADPVRLAVGLPIGSEAAYFVGGGGPFGQDDDESVVDFSSPPSGQPSLWCDWITDGASLRWDDGSEKFYNYIEWMGYLIEHFFEPWDRVLDGTVSWSGDDPADVGVIRVRSNKVTSKRPGALQSAWNRLRRWLSDRVQV